MKIRVPIKSVHGEYATAEITLEVVKVAGYPIEHADELIPDEIEELGHALISGDYEVLERRPDPVITQAFAAL